MGQRGQPAAPDVDARQDEQNEADEAAILEIERFEWAAPDRIELAGVWSGLRGRRFIRPTLVLRREGTTKRLLALLEHKPWKPDEDGRWIAAFAWDGAAEKFESAELNVGSGIDLDLPRPRMRPGKAPTRFRHRIVSRDGSSRDPDPLLATGVVTDAPAPVEHAEPKPDAERAEAKPKAERAEAKPKAERAEAKPKTEAVTADDSPRTADAPASDSAATPAVDAVATTAGDDLRQARAALEEERQSREAAIAAARAEEREKATRLMSEAAQLRAGVERQREMAFLERDDALTARDQALEAQAKALEEKKAAVAARKAAERERNLACQERDRAFKDRDRAVQARTDAERERERMREEREAAFNERDTIVSLHERGLPVRDPQPKFLPHEERSQAALWAPRAAAIALLLFFALVLLRLFAGL